jgi:thioredoxin reductase (NADPH)
MYDRYDIVVIGGGPAGLSAAITARSRNKNVLVVSNKPQNSPLAKSKFIDNYPGLPQVSGLQLLEQMIAHAHGLGAHFLYERVISVLSTGEGFTVVASGTSIDTRSVILATGAQFAKPFAGEEEYLGRGVSYCTTCDGMLYRGRVVCVVGLSPDAVDEANFLMEIGVKVVFLAKKPPQGLDPSAVVEEGTVVEVKGDGNYVAELSFRAKQSGKIEAIPCAGVFMLRPSISPDALLTGLELADGHIVVDDAMGTNKTGVFAAGDCAGAPLQVAKAVGDGQRACFSAVRYLDQR